VTKQAQINQASTATQAAQITPSATQPIPSATPQAPTQAPTQVPTQEPTVAIATASPTSTALPAACKPTRISFELGGTNIFLQGAISDKSTCRYVFAANKDQLINVYVQSTTPTYLSVSNSDGKILLPFSNEQNYYRGYLTVSGDWYLDVKAAPAASSYLLYLEIPERINFAPGTYSKNASGTVPAAGLHNYLIWANRGQKLSVNVTPAQTVILEIYDVNGDVLLSTHSSSSSFEVTLPSVGDYVVNVVNQTNSAVNYNISMEIR